MAGVFSCLGGSLDIYASGPDARGRSGPKVSSEVLTPRHRP